MKKTGRIQSMSLKYKILTVILTGFLVLFLAGIVSLNFVSNSYEKKLYNSIAATLTDSALEISDQLQYIDTIVDSILANQTIQDSLDRSGKSTQNSEKQLCFNQVYSTLCDYFFIFNSDAISYISVLQGNDVISTSNRKFQTVPESVRSKLLKTACDNQGATVTVTDHGPDYGIFIVKELRKIEGLSLDSLGVLIINIDMDAIISAATAASAEFEDISYYLYDDNSLIFNDSALSREDSDQLYKELKGDYDVVSLKNEKLFAVSGLIPIYGWNYICTVSYTSIYQAITLSSQSFFLIMVLAVIIVGIFSTKLVFALFRHFDRLIENMKQFGEGKYEIDAAPRAYQQDEIGLLYKNFDTMVEKINTLINENYVNELLKKEAQIKAMESQMDPHFLYNTLDSINWRARMIKSEEISQITTALGNLLRLSLGNNSKDFTLRQELTIVDNYIIIQKIRYQKRLDFSVKIPDSLLDIPIPKFTLQPLLENAIRYGLEESSETCYITITSHTEDNTVILKIMNTGSAFEENFMDKLLDGKIQPHGFGIGILNIHKRIQMTYGSEYGLHLYTIEDEETYEECAAAEIHIPYAQKEENKPC
nr:sensor histidine kinase [uncultured Blautia sp.]